MTALCARNLDRSALFTSIGEQSFLEAAERLRMIALIAGIAFFILRIEIYQFLIVGPGYSAWNMTAQFLRGLAAFHLVVAGVGFGRRFLNHRGKVFAWGGTCRFPFTCCIICH